MWTIPLRWEMLRNQEARASHWLQYWQRLNATGTCLCNVSQVEISKSGIKITLYILILLVHAHTRTQLYNMILTFPVCHAHWYFLFCYFNQDPLFRFQISLVERHDHMKETRIIKARNTLPNNMQTVFTTYVSGWNTLIQSSLFSISIHFQC